MNAKVTFPKARVSGIELNTGLDIVVSVTVSYDDLDIEEVKNLIDLSSSMKPIKVVVMEDE